MVVCLCVRLATYPGWTLLRQAPAPPEVEDGWMMLSSVSASCAVLSLFVLHLLLHPGQSGSELSALLSEQIKKLEKCT